MPELKTFEIDYEGEKKKVTYDADIPFGEVEEVLKLCVDISDVQKPKIKMTEYRIMILLRALKEAPFAINVAAIQKVPRKVMSKVISEVMTEYPLVVLLEDWMTSFLGSANMSELLSVPTPIVELSSDGQQNKSTKPPRTNSSKS